MMQYLQRAQNNFIEDKKANRKGAMEFFLNRDRNGSLKLSEAIGENCH